MQVRSRALAVSDQIYNLLLFVYPAPFRREYGIHMAQLFRDECRDTLRQSGLGGMIFLWFKILADLVKTALAEHIWEVFHMPIEKLLRGSGLAAILAGALWILLFSFDFNIVSEPGAGTLFIVILLLFAYGLAGLYRRVPKHMATRFSFLIVFAGILLTAAGGLSVMLMAPASWWLLFISGFFVFGFGLVLVGIVTLVTGILSPWDFLPMLIGALLFGFVISGDEPTPPLQIVIGIAFGLSWAVLGFILWRTRPDTPDPALLA
jgi:hypothetical protein